VTGPRDRISDRTRRAPVRQGLRETDDAAQWNTDPVREEPWRSSIPQNAQAGAPTAEPGQSRQASRTRIFELDRQPIRRDTVSENIRPLNQHNAIVKRIFETQFKNLVAIRKPVEIEMSQFQPARCIVLNQREGRTGNRTMMPERVQDTAGQGGFSRAQFAPQGQQVTARQNAGQPFPERQRGGLVTERNLPRSCGLHFRSRTPIRDHADTSLSGSTKVLCIGISEFLQKIRCPRSIGGKHPAQAVRQDRLTVAVPCQEPTGHCCKDSFEPRMFVPRTGQLTRFTGAAECKAENRGRASDRSNNENECFGRHQQPFRRFHREPGPGWALERARPDLIVTTLVVCLRRLNRAIGCQ
jgi:hypothetical protein